MTSTLPIDQLKAIVGPSGVIDDPAAMAPYLIEWRDRYRGTAPLIVRPASTKEVADVVSLCAYHKVPMTPQGGNTGLVGGQIPFGQVLINLGRMTRIRDLNPKDNTITVEAGVILAEIQKAAEEADRFFPLSLAAEGSCQIGGNLATNAGGVNVLRYGNARAQALGLEAVLPDGRVWNGLRRLHKDNTGYDLKQLLIGSEGTLGIITAATLKLYPKPRDTATAFAAIPDVEAGVRLLHLTQGVSGGQVSSFELMPRIGLEFVLRHMNSARDPLPQPYDWYVLLELTAGRTDSLRPVMEEALVQGTEQGLVRDAAIAENESQRADFWHLRESLSEAQKPEGGSIKHDVSVPVSAYGAFIAEANAAVTRACPGIRPVPFGHLGDGNVHFNLSQPVGTDKADFLARWEELSAIVHEIAAAHGGSISAEHGIGVMKRDMLPQFKSEVEMDLMRTIKRALDPHGLMNPGKLL